jgi:nitrogen fixation NifU-like protein
MGMALRQRATLVWAEIPNDGTDCLLQGIRQMSRFSDTVMEHAQSPINRITWEAADAVGVAGTPGRGHYLVVQVLLDGDKIKDSAFQCHHCGATVAAGSVLMDLIEGLTIETCLLLTADDVLNALDGLPRDKKHCADLAIIALQNALSPPPPF